MLENLRSGCRDAQIDITVIIDTCFWEKTRNRPTDDDGCKHLQSAVGLNFASLNKTGARRVSEMWVAFCLFCGEAFARIFFVHVNNWKEHWAAKT